MKATVLTNKKRIITLEPVMTQHAKQDPFTLLTSAHAWPIDLSSSSAPFHTNNTFPTPPRVGFQKFELLYSLSPNLEFAEFRNLDSVNHC
jgi:hypothetical protein